MLPDDCIQSRSTLTVKNAITTLSRNHGALDSKIASFDRILVPKTPNGPLCSSQHSLSQLSRLLLNLFRVIVVNHMNFLKFIPLGPIEPTMILIGGSTSAGRFLVFPGAAVHLEAKHVVPLIVLGSIAQVLRSKVANLLICSIFFINDCARTDPPGPNSLASRSLHLDDFSHLCR